MTEGAEAGIGARIMARRKAFGMKRPELAERLGVKPNTLYRYEIGSIGIRDSMKSRIAKELGVSLAYLVSGAVEGERERGPAETPEPIVPPQIYLPILDQEACAGSGFNWSDMRAGARKWMPWPTLETGGPVGPTKPYFVKVEGDSMIGANIQDGCLILVNPNAETFMNLSGRSVKAVADFYKPERVIVIHDDLDLNFGVVKFKKGGGNGGHNGLKSIDALIGADYERVRIDSLNC